MSGLDAALPWPDLLGLMLHFMLLSLLAVGGAITTAPDMHRYVVLENRWLSDADFGASVAIAQAAPGPNVLFVAVIGWNVAGPWGAFATLFGTLLPSTVLTLWLARWGQQRRESRGLRAFSAGMAPLTLGLLVATGWVLVEPLVRDGPQRIGVLALVALTTVVIGRSRLSPIWLVALGAVLGALGAA